MKRKTRNTKTSVYFILLLITVFAASTGISYFYLKGKFEFDSSFIDDIVSGQSRTEHKEMEESERMLYESIENTPESLETGRHSSLTAAESMIKEYMKIYKVRLLDLYIDREGIIYVDFGGELKKKFAGDASEELNIIAGLVTTMEKAVPGFRALKILIEGYETSTLGGHIDISRPIGREIAENI